MLHQTSRDRRGYALVVALVCCFLVLSLILGLTTSQMISLGGVRRLDRLLQNEQAVAFEELRLVKGVNARPSWLRASVSTTSVNTTFQDWSSQLFVTDSNQRWNLPSLRRAAQQKSPITSESQAFPGHLYSTTALAPASVGAVKLNRSFSVTSQDSAFAAWAGQGNVTLANVSSWSNPLISANAPDPLGPSNLASLSPQVFAQGSVAISQFPYGTAWTAGNGTQMQINSKTSAAALGYALAPSLSHVPAGLDMDKLLRQDIVSFKKGLQKATGSGDRNPQFSEKIGISQTLGLFFTQFLAPTQLRNNLSVYESQNFPLPVLPGLANMNDLLWCIVLHCPYNPDGSLDSGWSQSVMSAINDLLSILDPINWVIQQINTLQTEIDNMSWWDPAKYPLEVAVATLKAQLEMIETMAEIPIGFICTSLEGALAISGKRATPLTRAEEAAQSKAGTLSKAGSNYWPYREIANRIADLVSKMVAGNFAQIGQDLYANVSLTLFGQSNKKQSWAWGQELTSRATWTVPRGRVLVLKQGLSIQGDLWLHRGSLCCIMGNLSLSPGDNQTQGRIFLEEGAVLYVSGDLKVSGSLAGGSLVVGSPLGQVHPITTGVFASGNIDLPFGTIAGVSLDEVPMPNSDALCSASIGLFRPMLSGSGAKLAKIDGPFHTRLPYISTYAATAQMICVADVPLVPWVAPMPFSNLHIYAFRGLTQMFSPTLNLSLGEIFQTHCDWWGQGHEEQSALFGKLEVAAAQSALAHLVVPPWPVANSELDSRVNQLLGFVEPQDIDRLSNSLCIQIGESIIGLLPDWNELPTGDIFNHIIENLYKQYDVDAQDSQLQTMIPTNEWAGLGPSLTQAWQAMASAAPQSGLAAQAQEVPGVLVYAGASLRIGQGAPAPSPVLASGYFIAEQDIQLSNQLTVGAVASFQGDIRGNTLLYYPAYTRASLALPVPESDDWRQRATTTTYSTSDPSNRITVGSWSARILSEGWQE